MDKCRILGIDVDKVTMDEAVAVAKGFFGGGVHTVFTPNPEIIMLSQKDDELKRILNEADLVLPDGIGVVIASRLVKNPLPERVAGYDFVCRLLDMGFSFYLFGAKPGVADLAAERLRARGVNIVGTHSGYFDDDTEIINDINAKKPDVLLVCLGAPKQEKWINRNKNRLDVKVCIGAGGTLDGLSGNVKRAPEIFIRLNLEWLYRAIIRPSRFIRLAALPKFLISVLKSK
ncbi:MAG: putative N-acetylmannosaminyltransferase [Firmicutes bacterium ADurb.Bin193]|nr:MAG: putative N-acetylmannosaminyltransferase [Firmicutes bacterium ADurb.Bin193]